jgi:anti-sigma factor RsiW
MLCESWQDAILRCQDLAATERVALDAHLVQCPECREYHAQAVRLDTELTAAFTGVHLNPGAVAEVTRRAPSATPALGPSLLPEVLDFVGGASAAAALGAAALWFYPALPSAVAVAVPATFLVLAAAFIAGSAFADLKS